MKIKYLTVPFVLSVLLISGCKDDEVLPGPVTDTMYSPDIEEKREEEIVIRSQNSGIILDDREREMKEGANFHEMGDITDKTDFIIRPNSSSLSENKTPDTPNTPKPSNGFKIYLDPGHGGDAACDTEFNGVVCPRLAGGVAMGQFPANSLGTTIGTSGGGYSECDVVFQIADKTKEILEFNGYEVVLSRDDVHPAALGGGTAIGNWERGRLAASYDVWVAFHADGGGGSGFHCVVYNSDPSYRNDLCDDFIYYIEGKTRPIYTASGFHKGYSGNSSVILQAPSTYINSGGNIDNLLYIETGFMDNTDDLNYMVSAQGQDDIANAVLYALDNHFDAINKSDNNSNTDEGDDVLVVEQ